MTARWLLLLVSLSSVWGVFHSIELVPSEVEIAAATPSTCTGPLNAYRPANHGKPEIIISAFFPFPASQEDGDGSEPASRELTNGHYLIPAALLALDEINNNSGLLPDHHLWLDIRDSSCDKYQGVWELISSVREARTAPLAVLGGGCSAVSAGLGLLSPRYELLQVSYGNNPSPPDRGHPFFQIVETYDQMLRTALVLLDHFKWTHNVALIYQENEIYTTILERVVRGTFGENFTLSISDPDININVVVYHELLQRDNIPASIETFFGNVRHKTTRVIFGAVSENYAYQLLCQAKSEDKPGSGFVWVFTGSYSETWWQQNTTCNLTAEDVESVLVISSEVRNLNQDAALETSGETFAEFETEYKARLQEWCPGALGEALAATAYDGVWAIAFALNATIHDSNSSSNYTASSLYNRLLDSLSEVVFTGASGTVKFNDGRGRIGIDTIHQIQGGQQKLVGIYDSKILNFSTGNSSLRWPDGVQPSDTPEDIDESVPLLYIVPAVVITVTGMVFSAAMFVFNWLYRKHRILMAGSQRLNYFILVGTCLGFLSVLMLSVLESDLGTKMSGQTFAFFCVVRVTALSMAFTLAYGTMFARAWRIYRIFNDPWIAKRPLRDYHLMLMVGVLLVGDLIILVPWAAIDTYRRFTSTSEYDYKDYSRCTYLTCGSTYLFLWLAAVGLYKILLMLGGVFVVSLVRKGVVERKIFDDSKALTIALYVTAISFMLGLPLQFLFVLQFQVVLAFIASAVWVNVSAYGTLICVFLPKFYAIVIKKDSGRQLRSLKSVFYVAHPELRRSCSPETEFTEYRRSPECPMSPETVNSSDHVPITNSIITGSDSVHALPDSVAKGVSFHDSVDYIY